MSMPSRQKASFTNRNCASNTGSIGCPLQAVGWADRLDLPPPSLMHPGALAVGVSGCPLTHPGQGSMDMAAPQELAGDRHADLLPLALSRPNEALKRARAVLAGDPPARDASVARQAVGIVLREFG